MPATLPRYTDYARFLASIGINSIVINNVNACDRENRPLLSSPYIKKAAGLGELFARYGIATLLCPCFGAPQINGGLNTSDPLNAAVIQWWETKVEEISRGVPGFAGFLIKADSESEQGPSVWNRSIVDGANMLARVLEPHRWVWV